MRSSLQEPMMMGEPTRQGEVVKDSPKRCDVDKAVGVVRGGVELR
jgi:hypothetical protein